MRLTEDEMRAGFVAGTWPHRPTPAARELGEPCPCGNDGIHCDKIDDDR